MKNQRKNKRVQCMVPVDGKEGGVFDNLRTLDISKGGIGFVSQKDIPLNEKIAIELDIEKDQNPIFAVGKVQWVVRMPDSESFRIGMTFDDVFQGSKTRLNKYFSKVD